MIFVSSTEPPSLRALGQSSTLSEQFGCDLIWTSPLGMVGIQRKVFPGDLLSSLHDGRMGTLLSKMEPLDIRVMIFEGTPVFTEQGDLLFQYGNLTRDALTNLQFSLQVNHGMIVYWTESLNDTIRVVLSMYEYSQKGKHSQLDSRAGGNKRWGKIDSAEYAQYLLESVPGIGSGRAAKIIQGLGGRLPVRYIGTREELLAIPGVGPHLADAIIAAFGGIE